MITAKQPIGIFDSGIGGLTIAKAVCERLPNEDIIYFGDTSHLPYGEKSTAAIQAYSIKIAEMLLQQNCKVILIACNTASAAAYELVKEYVDGKAHVVNVIDPIVGHLQQCHTDKNVGLIGTKRTISSNIYKKKVDNLNLSLKLNSHPTPLLAAAIEEGFANKKVIDEILSEYLAHPKLQDIDSLVLGCTHYPVIKQQIAKFYKQEVNVIDTTEIIAEAVAECLNLYKLNNDNTTTNKHFYISDYTESFAAATKLFFSESISLEHYPLWG